MKTDSYYGWRLRSIQAVAVEQPLPVRFFQVRIGGALCGATGLTPTDALLAAIEEFRDDIDILFTDEEPKGRAKISDHYRRLNLSIFEHEPDDTGATR